ncbi:hypothetical protein, partial [Xenorhabdus bovienii]|uniref:hypothetical protein n=1 Tax=Xenorhabdus bovienii TaxID=40576 RepID=UPI0023B27EE5
DLMMEYAKLAKETDRPWEHFEVFYYDANRWYSMAGEICFNVDANKKYRLKPRTIRIGKFDIPEPVREPLENEQRYYYPSISDDDAWYRSSVWEGDSYDNAQLQRGLIHLDHESAEIHAQALISLTRK